MLGGKGLLPLGMCHEHKDLQVRDFVRRRRWLRHRVRKPVEPSQAAVTRQAEGSAEAAGPALSRTSMASSAGTGPIVGPPSHIFAAPQRSLNGSFTSQPGASQRSLASQGAVGDRSTSFTSPSGTSPGQGTAPQEKPWTSLADTQQALSSQCNKWGTAVVSELHKAISSVEGDSSSVARDSMHSDDYVGNSPMAAGLNRLSGPSQAFQPSGLSSTQFSSDSLPPAAVHSNSQGQFMRESTPQTMGTAGGILVAPHLAQATGHADISGAAAAPQPLPSSNIQSRLSNTPLFGGDTVQHPQSEDFPSAEELSPERSTPSAPAMVGQVRHGRLDMSDDIPMAALPASAVAAGFSRPEDSPSVTQNIDQQSGPLDSHANGHQHAYEKPGLVLARPSEAESMQP